MITDSQHFVRRDACESTFESQWKQALTHKKSPAVELVVVVVSGGVESQSPHGASARWVYQPPVSGDGGNERTQEQEGEHLPGCQLLQKKRNVNQPPIANLGQD